MFGRGQGELRRELRELRAELDKTQSQVRQLVGEQDALAVQVHKWMRRALAAERAALERVGSGDAVSRTVPGEPRAVSRLWGARRRIEARRAMRGMMPRGLVEELRNGDGKPGAGEEAPARESEGEA